MWNVVVLAVLIAVGGVYATANFRSLDQARGRLAASAAADMGIYRNAVVDYFGDHDMFPASVTLGALKAGGYLPDWSRMFQQGALPIWRNYRDGNGVIYIYAASVPDPNLNGELAKLARDSLLFGVYRTGAGTLRSPAAGDTGIPVSALAGMGVPDGAPVWIAMKK